LISQQGLRCGLCMGATLSLHMQRVNQDAGSHVTTHWLCEEHPTATGKQV